ncbi:Na+/H+ antiporter [Paenibacillus sp. sgz500958]|uniref:Na+/H+ antiporter n=1 Tax=Paenibacillus sp. sgz500958 TaxID=3242475 RepID=UPI0036D3A545
MELFEYILLMLVAVSASNLINRFIPSISVPIIQIALGVLMTLLPLEYELRLNPELFFLLFIAPLLFSDGKYSDKESLWKLKKPILLLALGLVFMTVAAMGYLVNWLIPMIPLAASFALAAALAPTDAVAVGALEDKVKIPHQTMRMLEGESLINDSSGLVSFQFAVAAMVTGAFSLKSAGLTFVGLSIGGIILGLILTASKYLFVKWLRKLGMENVTLHMLIEILTPFIFFLAAEELGVNGILTVVSAGIAHSFNRQRLNPEVAKLNIVSKSTWSVLIFVLNGLVFLLLGTQLPDIIRTIWTASEPGHSQVIFYSLALTAALLGLRLIWAYVMQIPRNYALGISLRDKFKEALILSLSGVRGTITLASTMSLPFVLNDGSPFPGRDLIIFLAAGVIVWTLLAANFLLPVVVGEDIEAGKREAETEAQMDILRNVVMGLNEQATDSNGLALGEIINAYTTRIRKLNRSENRDQIEKSLRISTLEWERENTLQLMNQKAVNPYVAHRHLRKLNRILYIYTHHDRFKRELLPIRQLPEVTGMLQQVRLSSRERRNLFNSLIIQNTSYVSQKLNEILAKGETDIDIVSTFILHYERRLMRLNKNAADLSTRQELDLEMQKLGKIGVQLERDYVQMFYENGRISRTCMKELKNNIALMEHDLIEESDYVAAELF